MNRKTQNKRMNAFFRIFGIFCTFAGLILLCVLLTDILIDGFGRLNKSFFLNFPSRKPQEAGILSAWVGTIWLMAVTAIAAIPVGVGAGVYLEEYARKNRLTNFIELNIANLGGVPSIIYGLLGLGLFVRYMHLGRSVLAGGLTLALLILPVIILSTREALRAVPFSIREGSFALGATKWQTVRHQVLPAAFGNILTGIILAMSRAIGETAPLITIGALTYIAFLPQSPISSSELTGISFSLRGLLDPFTALPIQIFNWISRPQKEFHANAAAGILVLLFLTLAMNALAIILRHRYQKRTW
jgi:phosphate transport system permease protein